MLKGHQSAIHPTWVDGDTELKEEICTLRQQLQHWRTLHYQKDQQIKGLLATLGVSEGQDVKDLFVMLSHNSYADVLKKLEDRVAHMYASRHEYPLWPMHDGVMDSFEHEYHGWIRRAYYHAAKQLIRTLRDLRKIR